MSLFRKLVKTTINVALLPVEVAKDVLTMGNVGSTNGTFTGQQLQKIKDEADE